MDALVNKSTKQHGATGPGMDDKILVISCVTLIAVLSIGLAGGVIWTFRSDVGEASGLIQAILSVVMSIVTGLMGIAVGRGLPGVTGPSGPTTRGSSGEGSGQHSSQRGDLELESKAKRGSVG